jgi:hypothetical protein
MGWPSWEDVDEEAQADFLVREVALAQADGVHDVCWYTLEDGDSPEANPEEAFGLARAGPGAWKPAGEAYVELSESLGALGGPMSCYGRAVEALDLPDGVFAVRWSDGLDALTALWTIGGEVEVTLPGLDRDGTPVTATAGPRPALVRQEGSLPGR